MHACSQLFGEGKNVIRGSRYAKGPVESAASSGGSGGSGSSYSAGGSEEKSVDTDPLAIVGHGALSLALAFGQLRVIAELLDQLCRQ